MEESFIGEVEYCKHVHWVSSHNPLASVRVAQMETNSWERNIRSSASSGTLCIHREWVPS